jgi:hypothetical protein
MDESRLFGLIEAGVVRINSHGVGVAAIERSARRTKIRARHAAGADLQRQEVGGPVTREPHEIGRAQPVVAAKIAAGVRTRAEVLNLRQILPVKLRPDRDTAAADIRHFKRRLRRLVSAPRVCGRRIDPETPLGERHPIASP